MPSTEQPVPLTELDAVNMMLRSIGESVVSSVTNVSKPQVLRAQAVLAERSIVVQSDGWNFCSERKLTLTPSTDTFIYLPDGLLSLEPIEESAYDEVVMREGRLYNSGTSSFVFTAPVKVRAVVAIPFEDLPQPARWYIALEAALSFASTERPGRSSIQFTAADAAKAKVALEVFDRRLRKGGMRRHNPHFSRMRGNR